MIEAFILIVVDSGRLKDITVEVYKTEAELMAEYNRLEEGALDVPRRPGTGRMTVVATKTICAFDATVGGRLVQTFPKETRYGKRKK